MTLRYVKDDYSEQDLLIDPDIPGQIGWKPLVEMARVAKNVPPNGIVVETGSLFGRSSFVWAKNVHPTVKVYCIDPWIREQWIMDLVEKVQHPAIPFSLKAFKYYVEGCNNIIPIQGFSPEIVKDWQFPIDLYFDDSVHEDPGLSRNWDFWLPFVKPNGIVCGDDYSPDFPDIMRKVHLLSEQWRIVPNTVGSFWWMHKPEEPN